MERNLNVFYNEAANMTIRMQQVNNEPWFVAKDVANALGITWSGHTLDAIPDDWQGMVSFTTPCGNYQGGGLQQLKVINEAALYKLAFRSNKPQADAFVNWVAGEVLPSIRQTGQYRIEGEAKQQPKRLPQLKHRPMFAEWKQRVKPYISRTELKGAADALCVTYTHVRKVYAGTAVSESVLRRITRLAKMNRTQNITYPDPVPICEQMVIEWDEEEDETNNQ